MEFRLLGPFEIVASEPVSIPRRRERCLLAVLLLEQGRSVPADRLADLLWDGSPPATARTALRSHVSRLRATVQPADVRIMKQGPGYLLRTDPERIDAHRFRTLVANARELTEPEQRSGMLRSALELWRGPVLADIATGLIRERIGAGLEELRLEALDQRISADLDAGRHRQLIAELRELISSHPNRERFTAQLMLALYRSGRQADALGVYDDNRRVLADELGLSPGPELRILHERILRADPSLDLTERAVLSERAVLAEPSQPPAPPARRVSGERRSLRQLPHDIANFTGRDRELAILDAVAETGREANVRAPTIVSIDGAPGAGKTTLAVHWAHRVAHHYPDVQLYVNLRGYGRGEPVTAAAAADTLLRGLGVDSELIPPGVEERSALLRSTLAARSVLMLLDNARDADQVRPLLPGTGSLVIVTSRNQLRGLSIRDGAHRLTLARLPRGQAIELLAGAVGPDRVATEPDAATRLVELCDRLPLALAIVAERAGRDGSLADVVSALEDEKARLDNLGTGEDDPHTDLRAALSWSYRALGDDAAAMFRKLGLHPANDIGVETAAALADLPVAKAKASLDQLLAAHLVEQRRPHRYELHDLMRLYATEAANRLETADDRGAAVRRVLDWYLHAVVGADTQLQPQRRRDFVSPYQPRTAPPVIDGPLAATTWFEQEYDCLRSVADWAAKNGYVGHTWRIALAMHTLFDRAIPWREGLEFYGSALRAAEGAGDRIGAAYTLNSLGSLHFNKGDVASSKPYSERALGLFQEMAHIRGTAMSLGNLGLIHGMLGDHDSSLKYSIQALELCEQLKYQRGVATNLDNIGVALAVAGKHDQAIDCHLQASAINLELGDTSSESQNQHHLAVAYAGLGDTLRSTRAFRTAINLYRQVGSKRWEAAAFADFGTMLMDADHPELARGMLETALVTMTEFADLRASEVQAALAKLPRASQPFSSQVTRPTS